MYYLFILLNLFVIFAYYLDIIKFFKQLPVELRTVAGTVMSIWITSAVPSEQLTFFLDTAIKCLKY